MAKMSPEQRWTEAVLERYEAFRISQDFRMLRKQGLRSLGRRKLYLPDEWGKTFAERTYSSKYRLWFEQCQIIATKYSLSEVTLPLACLVKGYDPRQSGLIIESLWPAISIITSQSDQDFLAKLIYEAQKLGIPVIHREQSAENVLIHTDFSNMTPPLPESLPSADIAFHIRIEMPSGFPPEAGVHLAQKANRIQKQVLKGLGYPVRERIKSSRLIKQAKVLKLGQSPLPSGGIYELISNQELIGERLQKRRKKITNQRHLLKKRLIDPYKTPHTKPEDPAQ